MQGLNEKALEAQKKMDRVVEKLVDRLGLSSIEKIEKYFEMADSIKKDGNLDEKEFGDLLRLARADITPDEIKELFFYADLDGDSKLTMKEFISMLMRTNENQIMLMISDYKSLIKEIIV